MWVCSFDFASEYSVITDVLVRVHAFIECGEIDEGFEDGADLAFGVGGAVVFGMVGISATYDGDDASCMVFYADESTLDVLWVSLVVVLRVGLVELEVSWFSLNISKVVLECAFGFFLEFEVERGFDGESAHLDVIFF